MRLNAEDYEARLRAEIERDKRWLDHERAHHSDFDETLAEREANVPALARGLVASDEAAARHRVNVTLSDRLIRIRVGDVYKVPTPDEVSEALSHYGATDDLFRLTCSCLDRPASECALVRLHRQETESAEQAAERAAREAVIRQLTSEYRMAEHIADREAEKAVEGV